MTAQAPSDLASPRLGPWLGACAFDWAVIVATFALVDALDHPLATFGALFVLGSRQQGLGALFHDAAHRLATPDRRVNDILGNLLCAFPLGLTLDGYRRYHFAHHKHLGSAADPENEHKRVAGQWRLPARLGPTVAHFLTDFAGGGVPHLIAAAKLTRPSLLTGAALSVYWLSALSIAWAFDALWIVLLWVGSIATVFWGGVRFRIFTEHLGVDGTHRIRIPTWLAWFWMPHNIGLHWEHHTHPNVPFWRLGELRERHASPAVIGLSQLLRDFGRAAPLASGDVEAGQKSLRLASLGKALPSSSKAFAFVLHGLIPLVVGSAIYAVARPNPPTLVAWLMALPVHLPGASTLISWTADMPGQRFISDALWAYALTATLIIVWRDDYRKSAQWAAVGAGVAGGWELFQLWHWLPGHFSLADLLSSLVASALAWAVCRPAHLKETPNEQPEA